MQTLATPLALPAVASSRARIAAYVQVLLFVAGWAALGRALALDANAYLVLGIPLTIAFQLAVRRRPLREIWLRDGAAFRLGRRGVLIAIGLAIAPAAALPGVLQTESWQVVCWMLAALAGAIAGGYAFARLTKASARELLLCLATVGVPASLVLVGGALARNHALHLPFQPRLLVGMRSFSLYVPVCFCVEEVAFRGVLDAHVHRQGARHGFGSALFVSVLWGLWHWPLVPAVGPWAAVPLQLITVHSLVGVPLSYFWRRSGNLAVPAVTHAFIDGVRNALLAQLS